MSHFAEYKLEREENESSETNEGFICYSINGVDCYIEDIFVSKDYRRYGATTKMADLVSEIAKKMGVNYCLDAVVPKANGSHESMLSILSYGFKLYESRDNIVFLLRSCNGFSFSSISNGLNSVRDTVNNATGTRLGDAVPYLVGGPTGGSAYYAMGLDKKALMLQKLQELMKIYQS